jgi:hypothetical protein
MRLSQDCEMFAGRIAMQKWFYICEPQHSGIQNIRRMVHLEYRLHKGLHSYSDSFHQYQRGKWSTLQINKYSYEQEKHRFIYRFVLFAFVCL